MIGIVGGGAWGSALACIAARAGHEVRLLLRDRAAAAALARRRVSPRLPGVRLAAPIEPVSDPAAVNDLPLLLLTVPAQALRDALRALTPGAGGTLLICAKGLERPDGTRLSDIVRAVAPQSEPAVLSGPSFAAETARGQPTAVTIAAPSLDRAKALCAMLATAGFRPYPTDDMAGVEIGGALKNVMAIAAGITTARRLGQNARAALIARGLAELMRLGATLGARPETMVGLSGLGDLVLSSTSLRSRNMRFGWELARGRLATQLMGETARLAEGAWTAAGALRLADRHGVDLPITRATAAVIEGTLGIDAALEQLMARPLADRE